MSFFAMHRKINIIRKTAITYLCIGHCMYSFLKYITSKSTDWLKHDCTPRYWDIRYTAGFVV